jgi:hypothetical protein
MEAGGKDRLESQIGDHTNRAASVAVDSNAKDFYSSGLQPAKEYDSQEKMVDGLGHEGQQDRGNTD